MSASSSSSRPMRRRLALGLLLVATMLPLGTSVGTCAGPAIELNVGVGCDFSGFFTEALGIHSALRASGVCVRTPLLSRCEPEMRRALTAEERAVAHDAGHFANDKKDPDVEVRWHLGETWACPWTPQDVKAAEGRGTVAVLRSMTEKVRLSPAVIRCCEVAHETWVPTEWHRKLYHSEGCLNARALPEVVDDAVFRPKPRRDGPARSTTRLLSVFQWQARKAPDALLAAYWSTFTKEDDVVLRIRASVPSWAGLPFQDAAGGVAHHARQLHDKEPHQLAAVETIAGGGLSREEMAALYRDADAFVLPSRGEGWCLPCLEAMASDTLLIASDFSGGDRGGLFFFSPFYEVRPSCVPTFTFRRSFCFRFLNLSSESLVSLDGGYETVFKDNAVSLRWSATCPRRYDGANARYTPKQNSAESSKKLLLFGIEERAVGNHESTRKRRSLFSRHD